MERMNQEMIKKKKKVFSGMTCLRQKQNTFQLNPFLKVRPELTLE